MKTCRILISLILQLGIASMLCAGGMGLERFPKDTIPQDSSIRKSKSCFIPIGIQNLHNNSVKDYFGHFGTNPQFRKAKSLADVQFSGVFRFVTIYRNMQKSYEDQLTSDRNLSFMDYPATDIGSSGGVGNPMLALALTTNVNKSASFRLSYAIGHLFAGSQDHSISKFFKSFGGMAFEGNIKTTPAIINFKYGGLLSLRVSRLIFDAPKYRNNYFDRLVSNNYSVGKYESMYGKDEEGKSFLYPYVKGAIAKVTLPDLNGLQFLAMYGRTGHTIIGTPDIMDEFPAVNYLLRVRTPYRIRNYKGGFAVNYYMKDADTDAIHGIKDDVQLISTDFDINLGPKILIMAEAGISEIRNPLIHNPTWGKAFITNVGLDKTLLKIPLSLEYYNIDHDYGNLDGEVLNSNVNLKDGGVSASGATDQTLFINSAQEVGLVANNRAGVNLSTGFNVGDLRVDIGYGVSQEKENIYDSITFQHRVNAFSRSRFWQWRQGIGPYNRIRSIYARTFELLTINDNALGLGTDYKKGFNNIELLTRYQTTIFNKRFIFANFCNYVSIQDKLSPTPLFNDAAFIRTFFEDLTIICKLTNKFMLLGNYGIERVWGNTRVDLSPDKVTDATGNIISDKERTINQTGHAYGLGLGFDISNNTTFHFRHKWMYHKDKNFLKDEFKGQETTIELKIFI